MEFNGETETLDSEDVKYQILWQSNSYTIIFYKTMQF
jgi:hypothetical protein